MIDITQTILKLKGVGTRVPAAASIDSLAEIVEKTGGWTDWDEYSDEFWARVLRDRSVLAIVCMYAPVIFVVDHAVDVSSAAFTTHDVPGFDAECLTTTREVLVDVFGDRAAGNEINPELFALSDLWFISV